MRRINFLIAVVSLLILNSKICAQQNINYGNNPQAGNYFNNNGVKIYYEIYGEGKPVVLLHGNGGSIAGRAYYIEQLSKKYKVIAIDSRCHGKSDCPAGYLTYDQMAEDVNQLLGHLKLDSAMIWGHSDGAILGLLLAIRHPDKVKKLLASGANLRPDTTAIDPSALSLLDLLSKQMLSDSIHAKQFHLLTDQPHIPDSDLQKIKSDVMVMGGDRDIIRIDHLIEIFRNIPGALLCILPGTTHFVYSDRKEWFTSILFDFFDNPPRRITTVELMMQSFKK